MRPTQPTFHIRPLRRGRYEARMAGDSHEVAEAQALRMQAFRPGQIGTGGLDQDAFDPRCLHVVLRSVATGALVCCFRLLMIERGRDIGQSYAAQFYGLEGLARYPGRMAEMGRFCLAPGCEDADVVRLAWAALTQFVDDNDIELLFGCSSFRGIAPWPHRQAFAMLQARYLGPASWRPSVKAADVVRLDCGADPAVDRKAAMAAMPPLLKTYLMMGGWVSDHAVVDADLGTLHVFTALEIRAIPPARARVLRAI